jgi:2-isopropylmalate synthase
MIMKETEETNKWDAKEYARFSKGQKKWAEELMTKLDIQPEDTILDIGCGDGKITVMLAAKTRGRVVGLDNDAGMITLASERYPNIEFVLMDASSIECTNRFSLVFSNAAMHWVRDHHALLRGIHNAMLPGGRMLLQFGGKGNAKDVIEIMNILIQEPKYQGFFRDFVYPWFFPAKDQYEQLLSEAGFENATVEMIPKDMVHESIEDFQGWLRTTSFPYIHSLPEEMRGEFIDTVTERYFEAFSPDAQSNIHIDMMRIEIVAIKNGYDHHSKPNKWNPKKYNKHTPFVSQLALPVVKLLSPQQNELILDVGCGEGTLAVEIERYGAKVIGIDSSEDMVSQSREKGIETHVGSVTDLPYNEEFDAVFSNATLHWVKDAKSAVRNIAKSLKPGGRFVAEFGGEGNVLNIMREMEAVFDEYPKFGLFEHPWYFPSIDEYHSLLESEGFEVTYIELIPRPTPMDDIANWFDVFTNGVTGHLDDNQYRLFIAEVKERLKPTNYTEEKGWMLDYVRLRVEAVKI